MMDLKRSIVPLFAIRNANSQTVRRKRPMGGVKATTAPRTPSPLDLASLSSASTCTTSLVEDDDNASVQQQQQQQQMQKKVVTFHQVEVHEFPVTLGDNPSAIGVPIQLDGMIPQSSQRIDLDEYENSKLYTRCTFQLQLSPAVRLDRVLNNGTVTMREIQSVLMESKQIQSSRQRRQRQRKTSQWQNVLSNHADLLRPRRTTLCLFVPEEDQLQSSTTTTTAATVTMSDSSECNPTSLDYSRSRCKQHDLLLCGA